MMMDWGLALLSRAKYLFFRARQSYRDEGLKTLIRRTRNYLFLKYHYNKKTILSECLFSSVTLIHRPRSEKSIAYLIQNYGCCGGHRIIFEHANRLAERGWNVSLLHLSPSISPKWFELDPKIKSQNFYRFNRWVPEAKAIVATHHLTLKYLLDLPQTFKKFYFVQSDERRFYEEKTINYFECEETYSVPGIHLFCGAKWLQEWLKKEFNRNASFIPGKVNFEHFYPEKKFYSNRPIVLVEGNVNLRYKGVQDAYEAIKNLNCEKWLLTNGSNGIPLYAKSFDKIWQIPKQNMLRQIISSADILIKPSYFEGSPLSPMEAMTCGTPVMISNHLGSNEYCIEGYNCLKFNPGDIVEIKRCAQRLIDDSELRNRLIKNGLEYARKNFDYTEAVDVLENILLNTKTGCPRVSYGEFRQSINSKFLNYFKNLKNE